MRTTATALAVGATALAIPTAAHAEAEPPSPLRSALRAPLAGHLTVAGQMRAARRDQLARSRTRRATRLARRFARARDARFSTRAYRRRLSGDSPARLQRRIQGLHRALHRAARRRAAQPAVSPTLQAIAACESGGNPATDTGNGFYGKYQFTLATWRSVGGAGNPAAAGEAEQDRRAAALYARAGASPWPVCGR